MKFDFLVKNFPKMPLLEEEFDKQKEKILKLFRNHSKKETIHISCHMEKNPHRQEYFTWINFYFPHKVFHVKEKASDALTSLKKSFSSLYMKIKKQKDKFLSLKRGKNASVI